MNKAVNLDSVKIDPGSQQAYMLREVTDDEIDIGELLRNLFREWKLIALVMVVGALCSIAFAIFLPNVYLAETKMRLPTEHELGDIAGQNIIEVIPKDTLKKVVDQILAIEVQASALENSDFGKKLSEDNDLSTIQLAQKFEDSFSVIPVKQDYYELEKGEKTPFEEVSISLKSSYPELATEYLRMLIEQAQVKALEVFSKDVRAVQQRKISDIREELESLTLAARQSREAEIRRIQETNKELIHQYQQEIELKLRKALRGRENRIIQLTEALKTADSLGIREPVTWDDLRPLRKSTQITNELGTKDNTQPLFFRGTRFLRAELDRLKGRIDDRPFVGGIVELENKIIQIENDPKVFALKSRQSDTIYIEKFDDLQRQLTSLQEQPVQFEDANMAIVSQAAVVSGPLRNPAIIVGVGIMLSGFLALLVAVVRISLRNSKERQSKVFAVDT